MITLEQLDELEGRIVRALELIGDLRSENSRLETENERLRSEHDELKLALDEKEKTVQSLKDQLDRTGAELNDLKQKEAVLEKRITEMLSRLSDVEGRPGTSSYSAPATPRSEPAPVASFAAPAATSAPVATPAAIPEEDDLITIEDDEPAPVIQSGDDESIVLLEDEDLPLQRATPVPPVPESVINESTASEEHGFTRQADYERAQPSVDAGEDEDIIILDDEDDDVIFADEDEIEIIEEAPAAVAVAPSTPAVSTADFTPPPEEEGSLALEDDILLDDDDDIGIFDMDDDDDFLIVEEDTRNT
ncbi:cell division protein ZapB [Leptonema illini]|uniref:Uncharacterized protein n=1 Tax=Leptonema illini DSM 21528 TaxID=929563 RepID=H2CF98_9LEPT|nr:cell division protein ZapB [Leptonema illini]EHQ06726.1 hypothetical protein Lepil_2045 [Leptonema illini DSM 21528]